jgi:hypothetical protein
LYAYIPTEKQILIFFIFRPGVLRLTAAPARNKLKANGSQFKTVPVLEERLTCLELPYCQAEMKEPEISPAFSTYSVSPCMTGPV